MNQHVTKLGSDPRARVTYLWGVAEMACTAAYRNGTISSFLIAVQTLMKTAFSVFTMRGSTLARLFVAATIAASLLGGCGGGGGGAGSTPPPPPPPPPPTSSTPLAFTAQNAVLATSISIGFTETALLMGRWAYEEVEAQRQRTLTSISGQCAVSGMREVTLVDADGSRTVTPGDTLRIQLTSCSVALLKSTLTGMVEIRIGAPSAAEATAAQLTIGSGGLRLSSSTSSEVVMGGGFAFEGWVGDEDTRLAISALSTTDLSLTLNVNNRLVVERLTPTSILHKMSLRSARYEYQATATLRSEALPGQVELTTITPLAGWLETLPDAGQLRLRGVGASGALVQPAVDSSSNVAAIRIDADGNGVPEANQAVDWNQMFEGYLWWPQSRLRPNEHARALAPGLLSPVMAIRRIPSLEQLTLRPTLQFDFTMPVDASALPQFKLVRIPAGSFFWGRPDDDWAETEVVLNAAVDGAKLVLSSPVQLQPGRTYAMRTRTPGNAQDDPHLVLRDALGRVTTVFLDPLNTRSDFAARAEFSLAAAAGAGPNDLSVDASRSSDARHPLAAYRWRQLSGPALEIDSPSAAQTVVRWRGAPPLEAATAVLELTVTNTAGEVDVATLPIDHLPLNGVPTLYFRSSPGSYVGDGKVHSIAAGNGSMFVSPLPRREGIVIRWIEAPTAPSSSGSEWGLSFSRQDGLPLTSGTYTTGLFSFDGVGRGTSSTAHIVRVIDVGWSSDGSLTRLALDFGSDSPDTRIYGSVRYNTAEPIRP